MPDRDGEKVERSLTIPVELEERAVREFDGGQPTEALRQAVRAGVECRDTQHARTIDRLVAMLYDCWLDQKD